MAVCYYARSPVAFTFGGYLAPRVVDFILVGWIRRVMSSFPAFSRFARYRVHIPLDSFTVLSRCAVPLARPRDTHTTRFRTFLAFTLAFVCGLTRILTGWVRGYRCCL